MAEELWGPCSGGGREFAPIGVLLLASSGLATRSGPGCATGVAVFDLVGDTHCIWLALAASTLCLGPCCTSLRAAGALGHGMDRQSWGAAVRATLLVLQVTAEEVPVSHFAKLS